jgi:hypothetical protein
MSMTNKTKCHEGHETEKLRCWKQKEKRKGAKNACSRLVSTVHPDNGKDLWVCLKNVSLAFVMTPTEVAISSEGESSSFQSHSV